MRKVWLLVKSAFWVAIIIAAMFILFTTLNVGGYQMFIVKSGSMEPKIKTGSVVIDKQVGKYSVGDVITFKASENTTVTHRIYKIQNKDGNTSYVVKGDANNSPDPNSVNSKNVIGKVWFSIPFLGYLIAFIRTLPGLIIFIILPTIIIVAEEISNIKIEAKKVRDNRKNKKVAAKDVNSESKEEPQEVFVVNKPVIERYKIGQDKEHVQ